MAPEHQGTVARGRSLVKHEWPFSLKSRTKTAGFGGARATIGGSMRRPFGFGCVALFGVVLAWYGLALGRYFTSEDFLLIRLLGDHPPWPDSGLLTGPGLGTTAGKSYG